MSAGATKWIWENSCASNGSLLVLLAIADEIGEGEFTEMKIAEIAAKARLSDRAARMAVKDLEGLGELSVTPSRGLGSRYALHPTPAKTAGPTPAKTAGPAKSAPRQKLPDPPKKPQVRPTPAKTAGPEIPDALDLGSVVSGERSRSRAVSGAPRPDVDRMCSHLADRIEGNGSKRPNIGKRWKDAARLLVDADGHTEEQVHACIDWCQQDKFWHRRILSMEKLREKYDQLRLDAKAEREKAAERKPRGRPDPDDDYEAALRRIHARKENANGNRGDGGNRAPGQVALPAAAD